MAAELTKKRKIRAGHRGSATRILSQVDAALADGTVSVDKLAQLKLCLTEKLDTLKLLDGEIIGLTEEKDLADEIEQSDGYKESVYGALVKLERAITIPTSAIPTTRAVTTAPKANPVKLPKLTLRSFDGELTSWSTFWDSFESAIHNNGQLSDVDKFNYLRSLLEKGAYDAISGLTLSAGNYQEAVAILKKRYGDKSQIISKHMDTLLSTEAVTSAHNLKGLRHLHDTVESHIRSLKTLGVTSDSYGSLLSPVLLKKLPQDLRLIISRKIVGREMKLDELLELVEEELVARERTMVNPMPAPPRGSTPHTAATLMSGTPSSNPTCSFCRQPHASVSCSKIPNITDRKQALLRAGRCFMCLRRGHRGRECRSGIRCRNCNGRHHVSICEGTRGGQPSGQNNAAPSNNTPMTNSSSTGLNPGALPFTTVPTTSSITAPTTSTASILCTGAQQAVLLQTARTAAHNPHKPQCKMEVRILLDRGSQRSYISQQVQEKLSLLPVGEQKLSIATFGAEGCTKDMSHCQRGIGTERWNHSTCLPVCDPYGL